MSNNDGKILDASGQFVQTESIFGMTEENAQAWLQNCTDLKLVAERDEIDNWIQMGEERKGAIDGIQGGLRKAARAIMAEQTRRQIKEEADA